MRKIAINNSLQYHFPEYVNNLIACHFKTKFTYANNILSWGNNTTLRQKLRPAIKDYMHAKKMQPLRIAFYGPPCTGKTYLAKLLAAYYDVKYISMAEIVGAFIQLRAYYIKWVVGRELAKLWKVKQRWLRKEKSRLLKVLNTNLRKEFLKCLAKFKVKMKKVKLKPSASTVINFKGEAVASTMENINRDTIASSDKRNLVLPIKMPKLFRFVPDRVYIRKKTFKRSIATTVGYSISSKLERIKTIKGQLEEPKDALTTNVASETFDTFSNKIRVIILKKKVEQEKPEAESDVNGEANAGAKPSLQVSKMIVPNAHDKMNKIKKLKFGKKKRTPKKKKHNKMSRFDAVPKYVSKEIIQSDAENPAGIRVGANTFYGKYIKIVKVPGVRKVEHDEDEGGAKGTQDFWRSVFQSYRERGLQFPWRIFSGSKNQGRGGKKRKKVKKVKPKIKDDERSIGEFSGSDDTLSDDSNDSGDHYVDADDVEEESEKDLTFVECTEVYSCATYEELYFGGEGFKKLQKVDKEEQKVTEWKTDEKKKVDRKKHKELIQKMEKREQEKKEEKEEDIRKRYKYIQKMERMRKQTLAKMRLRKKRQKKQTIKETKQKKEIAVKVQPEEKVELSKDDRRILEKIKKKRAKRKKELAFKAPIKYRKIGVSDRIAWSICMRKCCQTCCPSKLSKWFVKGSKFIMKGGKKCCEAYRPRKNYPNVTVAISKFLKRRNKIKPMVNIFRHSWTTRKTLKHYSNIAEINRRFTEDDLRWNFPAPSSSSTLSLDDEDLEPIDVLNVDDKPKHVLEAITRMPAVLKKFQNFKFRQKIQSLISFFIGEVNKLERARNYIVKQIKILTMKVRDTNYKGLFRFITYIGDVDRKSTLNELPNTINGRTLQLSRNLSLGRKSEYRRASKSSPSEGRSSRRPTLERPMQKKTTKKAQASRLSIVDKQKNKDKSTVQISKNLPGQNVPPPDKKRSPFLPRTSKNMKDWQRQAKERERQEKERERQEKERERQEKERDRIEKELDRIEKERQREEKDRASNISHTKQMFIETDNIFENMNKIRGIKRYHTFLLKWMNTTMPNRRPIKCFRTIFSKRKRRKKIKHFLKALREDWGKKYRIKLHNKQKKSSVRTKKLNKDVQCVESVKIRIKRFDNLFYPIRIFTLDSNGLRTIFRVKIKINEEDEKKEDKKEKSPKNLLATPGKSDEFDDTDKTADNKVIKKDGPTPKYNKKVAVRLNKQDEQRWRKKKKIQDKYFKMITKKVEKSLLLDKIKKKLRKKKKLKKTAPKLRIISTISKRNKKKKPVEIKMSKKIMKLLQRKKRIVLVKFTLYNFVRCYARNRVYRNTKESIQKNYVNLFKSVNSLTMQENISLDLPTYLLATLQTLIKDIQSYVPKLYYNLVSRTLNEGGIERKKLSINPIIYCRILGNVNAFQLNKIKESTNLYLSSLEDEKRDQFKDEQSSESIDCTPTAYYSVKTMSKEDDNEESLDLLNVIKNKPERKLKPDINKYEELLEENCKKLAIKNQQEKQYINQVSLESQNKRIDGVNKSLYRKNAFNPEERAHQLIRTSLEVPHFIYKNFVKSERYHQLSNNYFWIQNYEIVRSYLKGETEKKKRIYQEWDWRWMVKKRSPLKYIWNARICSARQQILKIHHRLKFISWQRKKERIRQYIHMYSLENLRYVEIKDLPELLKHTMTCYTPKKNRILSHCFDFLTLIWRAILLFRYENDENMIASITGEILRMNDYKSKGYVLDGLPMSSLAAKLVFKPRFTELFHKKQFKSKISLIKYRRRAKKKHKLRVRDVAKVRSQLRKRARLVSDYVVKNTKRLGLDSCVQDDDTDGLSTFTDNQENVKVSRATVREKLYNRWKYMKLLKSRLDPDEKYNPKKFKQFLKNSIPKEEYEYICSQLGLTTLDEGDQIISKIDYSLIQTRNSTLHAVIDLLEQNFEVNKLVTRLKGAHFLDHFVKKIFPKRAKLSYIRNIVALENYINLSKRKMKTDTPTKNDLKTRSYTALKRIYPEDKFIASKEKKHQREKKRKEKKLAKEHGLSKKYKKGESMYDESQYVDDNLFAENAIQRPLSTCYKKLMVYSRKKRVIFPLINVCIPKPRRMLKILKYRSKLKLATMKKIKKKLEKAKRKERRDYYKNIEPEEKNMYKQIINKILQKIIKFIIKKRYKTGKGMLLWRRRPQKRFIILKLGKHLKDILKSVFVKRKMPKEKSEDKKSLEFIKRKLKQEKQKYKNENELIISKCEMKDKEKRRRQKRRKKHHKNRRKRKHHRIHRGKTEDNYKKAEKTEHKSISEHHDLAGKLEVQIKVNNTEEMPFLQITNYQNNNEKHIKSHKKCPQKQKLQLTTDSDFLHTSLAKTLKKFLMKQFQRKKPIAKIFSKNQLALAKAEAKFSQNPRVILKPIFENEIHKIAMEQLDNKLKPSRSDNVDLTYPLIRMPSLRHSKGKLVGKKITTLKNAKVRSKLLERKRQLESLPLCDCQTGFKMPVISFATKDYDRYFSCNIKRILKMQAPSGPRLFINECGEMIKEEIPVPGKHFYVNYSVRLPQIKRLKKKINAQTNYMPQWVFNITRRATYVRIFSRTESLAETDAIYKRVNFFWFHDALNPTLLDYMSEKNVPVWTFNIKSRSNENIKKTLSKLIEIIGPGRKKPGWTYPETPSWVKNYPLNLNFQMPHKYNINICSDITTNPNLIWQKKSMKQIPKEVEGTLNKYFLEEDTSDKSLNTQMITEQEMRNILELDQKRKECITKMKHYINRKVNSVGKHLFWRLKQFSNLRTFAKEKISHQLFIALITVANSISEQLDVESFDDPRSREQYLDLIAKTGLKIVPDRVEEPRNVFNLPSDDDLTEEIIVPDHIEEPRSEFTLPSGDGFAKEIQSLPTRSKELLQEDMLGSSSRPSRKITDDFPIELSVTDSKVLQKLAECEYEKVKAEERVGELEAVEKIGIVEEEPPEKYKAKKMLEKEEYSGEKFLLEKELDTQQIETLEEEQLPESLSVEEDIVTKRDFKKELREIYEAQQKRRGLITKIHLDHEPDEPLTNYILSIDTTTETDHDNQNQRGVNESNQDDNVSTKSWAWKLIFGNKTEQPENRGQLTRTESNQSGGRGLSFGTALHEDRQPNGRVPDQTYENIQSTGIHSHCSDCESQSTSTNFDHTSDSIWQTNNTFLDHLSGNTRHLFGGNSEQAIDNRQSAGSGQSLGSSERLQGPFADQLRDNNSHLFNNDPNPSNRHITGTDSIQADINKQLSEQVILQSCIITPSIQKECGKNVNGTEQTIFIPSSSSSSQLPNNVSQLFSSSPLLISVQHSSVPPPKPKEVPAETARALPDATISSAPQSSTSVSKSPPTSPSLRATPKSSQESFTSSSESPFILDSPLSSTSHENVRLLYESYIRDINLDALAGRRDEHDLRSLPVDSDEIIQPTYEDRNSEFILNDFYDEFAMTLISWAELPKKREYLEKSSSDRSARPRINPIGLNIKSRKRNGRRRSPNKSV
ncbi:uncharacterized protein isoform X4 [Rhodnius prolixus]